MWSWLRRNPNYKFDPAILISWLSKYVICPFSTFWEPGAFQIPSAAHFALLCSSSIVVSPVLCHPQESIREDPIIIISLGSMFAFHFSATFFFLVFPAAEKPIFVRLSLLEKKWSHGTNARLYSITAKLHVCYYISSCRNTSGRTLKSISFT